MKIKKIIIIAVIATTTMYQVMSTYSICRGQENIHMIYEVKPGENLQSVARKFDTTTDRLQQLNGLGGLIVEPGTRLKVD